MLGTVEADGVTRRRRAGVAGSIAWAPQGWRLTGHVEIDRARRRVHVRGGMCSKRKKKRTRWAPRDAVVYGTSTFLAGGEKESKVVNNRVVLCLSDVNFHTTVT